MTHAPPAQNLHSEWLDRASGCDMPHSKHSIMSATKDSRVEW